MTHTEGKLTTPAGASLYYQCWMPEEDPKAVLLIAHGLAEHSGRYRHFADFFVKRGYTVFGLDHLGHGKSDGDRCHVRQFSEYKDGVSLALDRVRERFTETPVFLVGHSMGGLIATSLLIDRQSDYAGCILSGAAVQPAFELPAIQFLLMNLMSKVLPKLRILQLDSSDVSRDPEVVKRYREDPLVFNGKVTARLAEQLFSEMTAIKDKMSQIDIPMLILHGSEDAMTSLDGAKTLHEKISSKNKKLIIYDGLYHEVYNEPEQDKVMSDVADWLANMQ